MKCIITLSIFLVIQISIFAQTLPYNQEFQVNTYTYEDQIHTQVAVLTSGSIVFCWDSWEHLGSYRGVYAQMYDENGFKYGDEFHVNTYQDSYQVNPKIAALPSGGFVICWESNGQDGSGYGLFAQIFDENGIKVGEEFQINTYINGNQLAAAIKVFSNSEFIICWESDGQDGSGYGIFAQLFDNNGVKKGSEFQVNTYTSEYQFHPNILVLPTGGFIIVWDCSGQDGVYAQLFDEQTNRQGQEFRINSSLSGNSREPHVCLLNTNTILIYWRGSSFIPKIFAKLINSNGTTIKEEWQVNTSEDRWSWSPTAIVLKSGYFTICWEYINIHGSGANLRSQMFDNNGNKLGTEELVKNSLTGLLYSPSILSLPDSGYIISWHEQLQYDPNNYDVYAKIFDKNGNERHNEFRVNTNTGGNQTNVQLINITDKGFLAHWRSPDGSNVGVFGKYFLNEPIVHQVTEFNLVSPQNNETVYLTNPQFVWEQASDTRICFPWEIKYDLYISTDENFANSIIRTGVEDTTTILIGLTPGTNYYWKVVARNISGDSLWSSSVNQFYVDPNAVSGVDEDNDKLPADFSLSQNYPNPFNPSTKISWQTPVSGWQTLKVYDVLGNEVATLVNEYRSAGSYEIEFNPYSINQQPSSGIYLYRLQAGDPSTSSGQVYVETKKMILLK